MRKRTHISLIPILVLLFGIFFNLPKVGVLNLNQEFSQFDATYGSYDYNSINGLNQSSEDGIAQKFQSNLFLASFFFELNENEEYSDHFAPDIFHFRTYTYNITIGTPNLILSSSDIFDTSQGKRYILYHQLKIDC